MLVLGLIAAALAAALHLVIFYMESIAWEGALARRTFGGTPAEARPHAFYAFNQGFYNLFLAVETIAGIAIIAAGAQGVGSALVLAGTGSMLAAALVLLLSSRPHRVAALKQGALPLLAVVAIAVGLLA